jgi:serine/threonine-protein kinase RsbW
VTGSRFTVFATGEQPSGTSYGYNFLLGFMSRGKTVCLEFHSSYEILDFVQVASDHLGRLAGLDDEALHWVGVAVRESVINAIKHGNAGDEGKYVRVEFTPLNSHTPSGIAIRVRDEGAGFDPEKIPDPLAPENMLKSSGRGIFIIRNFMDEMVLQRAPEGGMEVVMVKRVTAAAQTDSDSRSSLPGE